MSDEVDLIKLKDLKDIEVSYDEFRLKRFHGRIIIDFADGEVSYIRHEYTIKKKKKKSENST